MVATRCIKGYGGYQRLLRKLLALQTGDHQLTVPCSMLDQVYRYAWSYGEGSYQNRLRTVLAAALRTGWKPEQQRTAA